VYVRNLIIEIMKQVNINLAGGKVSWGFKTNNQTVAYYRAALIDPNKPDPKDRVLKRWEHQRTADNVPDHFEIPFEAAEIVGCHLWIQAVIFDPTYAGKNYTSEIAVAQNGNFILNESYPGSVPAGKGKANGNTDEIVFI